MQFKPRQLQELYDLIQQEKAETHQRSRAEQCVLSALVEVDCKLYNKIQRLGTMHSNKVTVQFTATQLAAIAWLFEHWHPHLPASLYSPMQDIHMQLS
jgi:hypothetical protein